MQFYFKLTCSAPFEIYAPILHIQTPNGATVSCRGTRGIFLERKLSPLQAQIILCNLSNREEVTGICIRSPSSPSLLSSMCCHFSRTSPVDGLTVWTPGSCQGTEREPHQTCGTWPVNTGQAKWWCKLHDTKHKLLISPHSPLESFVQHKELIHGNMKCKMHLSLLNQITPTSKLGQFHYIFRQLQKKIPYILKFISKDFNVGGLSSEAHESKKSCIQEIWLLSIY